MSNRQRARPPTKGLLDGRNRAPAILKTHPTFPAAAFPVAVRTSALPGIRTELVAPGGRSPRPRRTQRRTGRAAAARSGALPSIQTAGAPLESRAMTCARRRRLILPSTPWDLGHVDNERSTDAGPEHGDAIARPPRGGCVAAFLSPTTARLAPSSGGRPTRAASTDVGRARGSSGGRTRVRLIDGSIRSTSFSHTAS